MAGDLTILHVPADAAAHAERFGAKRNSVGGTWYVVGPVPGELRNYIPKPKNQCVQEVAPKCPVCGAITRKLVNRRGDLYWACVMRHKTNCPGVVDYLDYLDAVAPLVTVSEYLPDLSGSLFGPAKSEVPKFEPSPHSLRQRWVEIAAVALETLGNGAQVIRWLECPKVALGHRAPISVLRTEEGCAKVLMLLREIWN